jgi:hypothetical protein
MEKERKLLLIDIQSRQLAEWRTVLNDDAFDALRRYAVSNNVKAERENKILRGNDLSVFICNYAANKYRNSLVD